jgi:hypothetical protein
MTSPNSPSREPAALIGLLTAAASLVAAFNLHWLTSGQVSLVVAAITAIGGAVIAWRTRPITPAAFTTVVSTGAALLAGYGYHVKPEVVAAISGVILSVLALITRAQVSPVAKAGAVSRPTAVR